MNRSHQLRRLAAILALTMLTPLLAFAQKSSQEINLDINKAPLTEVLKQIERQTSYRFSYANNDVSHVSSVNAHYKKATVSTVLTGVLKDTGLEYKILSPKLIAITKKSDSKTDNSVKGTRRISGTVEDDLGDPIPGATVKCIGNESVATATDIDGRL